MKEKDGVYSKPVCVTDEFLFDIQDSKGLTKGQLAVLAGFAGSDAVADWLGIEISAQAANFLEKCKGYRNGKYETS